MKNKISIFIIFLLIALTVLSGCTKPDISNDANNGENVTITPTMEADDNNQADDADTNNGNNTDTNIDNSNNGDNSNTESSVPPDNNIDLQKIKPNENGKVMILMYHGIGKEEAEWVRTADNFRKDLQTLYDNGYRLISLKDYLENNISVEAGYTPFVITFDDGLNNQFNYMEENGSLILDPNCAVGIMEAFFKSHPDFGRGASFYVYYPVPFRQKDLIKQKFEFLISHGYEIGNHSYNHDTLGDLNAEGIQKSLAMNVSNTAEYTNGYQVSTLALPNGVSPKGDNFKYAVSGEYNGQKYENKAILRVGSNPAPAPNSIKYDYTRLPRVRASEMKTEGLGLYDWLSYFDKHPNQRYISDGNPDTITIPKEEEKNLNNDSIKSKKLIEYDRQ